MAFFKNKEKIKIRVFMEVMGWPKENLTEHLKKVVNVLRENLKWKISREDYAEPEQASEKMYSTHVEFEAEFNDINQLFTFAMAHGPSVIEILEPSELYLSASEMQDILADMVSKAQSMDKEIKVLAAQNKQMSGFINMLEKKGIIKKEPPNDEQSPK
ncbi:MAG: hypothetical protein PHC66_03950 [Candidatus Nanoarchaeia archaeon]|nr:hypothetical protein [Candidatus Nanoarchaeia archaeon]MDD5239377.1 hypothetical protein [Candidatus Nanoarchaeia archaeon]